MPVTSLCPCSKKFLTMVHITKDHMYYYGDNAMIGGGIEIIDIVEKERHQNFMDYSKGLTENLSREHMIIRSLWKIWFGYSRTL